MEEWDAQHNTPKTGIVVAVGGMIDVAGDGARIDMIVPPRAATHAHRREPHSLRCPGRITRSSKACTCQKKSCAFGAEGLALRACGKAAPPPQ